MKKAAISTTVGIDIGYGNVKVVGQRAGSEQLDTIVLPVGAAPLINAPRTVSGKPDLRGGEAVLVGGAGWVAGIDPLALQGFARQTHEGYISTDEYLALFYGALSRLGYRQIDQLVTGLPCNHYFGPHGKEMRIEIAKRFQREHYIRQDFVAEVKKVHVITQPAGAYTSLLAEDPELAEGNDQMCVVLDVGFYSVDYVLFHGNSMRPKSSGSSLAASSAILMDAAQAIAERHQVSVTATRLETALRQGTETLTVAGVKIPIAQYMQDAAASAARVVFAELGSALRTEGNSIDKVLLTGGGAAWFEGPAIDQFGTQRVVKGNDPVLANAKGYQLLAAQAAGMASAA